jgi:hypothetical protein
VFGTTFANSDGRVICTRDIAEQHNAEDYWKGVVPVPSDFLHLIPLRDWMVPSADRTVSCHARESAARFGGQPADFRSVHELLDRSAAAWNDVRHQALTHHTFFFDIAIRVVGDELLLSDGTTVSTRAVCEQHVVADLGRIPSAADWVQDMPLEEWMMARPGHVPRSARPILARRAGRRRPERARLAAPDSALSQVHV